MPGTIAAMPVTMTALLVALLTAGLVATNSRDTSVAPQATAPVGPWLGQPPPGDTPVVFGTGLIATDAREINLVFSADGREAYLTRVVGGTARLLLLRRLSDGSWSAPERLQLVPGRPDADIADPALSPDGARLYFVSGAPTDEFGTGNGNIWVSRRQGDGWTAAALLPAPVNSPSAEYYPSVVADGSLYFSSNRPGGQGDLDLYRAKWHDGRFEAVVNLGAPVNTPQTEVDAYVSPDERLLVVSARREGNRGALDLYASVRTADGRWGELVALGDEVNTALTDYCPTVSADGRYFFFSRRTPQGGDVYWMRTPPALAVSSPR